MSRNNFIFGRNSFLLILDRGRDLCNSPFFFFFFFAFLQQNDEIQLSSFVKCFYGLDDLFQVLLNVTT